MLNRAARAASLAVLILLALATTHPIAQAAPQFDLTLTVNSEADAPAASPLNDGVCDTAADSHQCTLRAAIMKANNWHGGNVTIILPSLPPGHTYLLTNGPLGANDDGTGDLNLYPAAGRASVTLQGADAATTIIDGSALAPADRVLSIAPGVAVSIFYVTIQGGHASQGGGLANGGSLNLVGSILKGNQAVSAGQAQGVGAGLYNTGIVTLSSDLIAGNTSMGDSGGIFNGSVMALRYTNILGNVADIGDGGITNVGTLTLDHSEVAGNTAHSGGGITNSHGVLTMTASALTDNAGTTSTGGGLYNSCSVATLVNSTVSSNTSNGDGGGIANIDLGGPCGTDLKLRSDTLALNTTAASGGGLFNSSFSTVDLQDTILSNNQIGGAGFNPSDCSGVMASEGYNLISSTAGCIFTPASGDIVDQFALLRPLAYNGGLTHNHALNPDSPAVDAGSPGGCTDGANQLLTDQRDAPRLAFGRHSFTCDIGSFELQQTVDLPAIFR